MKVQATVAIITLLVCAGCASTQESTANTNFRSVNIERDITKLEIDREERLQQQIDTIEREARLEPKPSTNPTQNSGNP